jgi:hypothetical protein
VAEHKGRTSVDNAAYVMNALNDPVTDVLESVPIERKHEEFTVVLEHYGDHHQAKAFHGQLRRRVLHSGEFVAVDNLGHLAYVHLTQQHVRRQVSRNLRRQLLLLRGKKALSGWTQTDSLARDSVCSAWDARPGFHKRLARSSLQHHNKMSCGEPGNFRGDCPHGRDTASDPRLNT